MEISASNLQIFPEKSVKMSSDTDDDASDLKEFDYTAYRNLYTYHAHTLSKTLHRSRESQERLREFRNLAPKTEIRIFENSEILVTSEDVTSSEIVLELNGLVGTIQDRIERTPTLFRSDFMDTPLLILTSTGFHGPAYVIRRSAHPNCHLENVICHLEPIAWILKANKSIPRGTEITVAFDFPPERGTVDRPRPEVIRRRTVDEYDNVKARSILKKSTSSEIPKKKKKKSGGRWTTKTRKRKVGGAKTTVASKIQKLDSESIVTSSEAGKVDSGNLTFSESPKVKNSEATSSEAILTSSNSSKIVYSILTSSESQKTNSENLNPNLTSSKTQKIDNLDFENSEFQKLTSSDSDETQRLEKSVCPRVPMSAPLKRIRTENGWKTLPAKEKKIPPKIDNPQKSINQKKKKKKPRRQPWSSGGGRKKKTVVTSSDAPDDEIGNSKDFGVVVTSSNPPEVDKTIVTSSGAPATSSETGEFGIEYSGAPGTRLTSPESRNSDSEAPEALSTSSEFQNVEHHDSGAILTSYKNLEVKISDSEAPERSSTSSNSPEVEIYDAQDSEAIVTSSKSPEVKKSIVTSSGALHTSSETGEFEIEDSRAFVTSYETPEVKIEDSEAPEANLTSSESQKLQNQDSESLEDVVKIEDDSDVSMEFGEAADLLIFAENEEMSNVTSSEVPEEDSYLTTTTSSEISDSSDAFLKSLEAQNSTSSEIFQNTYSEDVIALLKTSVRKIPKTQKIRNYRAQNMKTRKFRKIQNPEDPEDVKLLALSTVNPGDILLELIGQVALLTEVPEDERSGKWMYTADFLTKNAQNSVFGDHRYTKSIFCIDPINECRFLRRSCKPNAHLDHFIDSEDVLRIIVTPIHSILKNSEITLNFDWDFAINSKEPLICALHQFNMSNCPVERQRLSRMFHLAMERVCGVEPPSISTVINSNPNSRPQFLEEHNYRSLSDGPKDVDLMVKSMKCELCHLFSTERKWNLLKHLQDVHKASPEDLAKLKELFKDRKSVYSMGKSWKCELCHSFSSNRKTNLYQHLRGVHKASPEDVAMVKEALKDRKSVDLMGKPWKCDRCDRFSTKRKSNLYEHLRGVHKASPEDVARVQKALKKKKAPKVPPKEASSAPSSSSSNK
ncbi:hypothetical protein B9Z55_003396 [Caenorhabditis nigoni]|uniref:SET domain-containing protein n=2 Tax=Caenorhabditis nigoni TaxID=1611254 RepID=A0A2G5VQF3_9PELO|nr:hypothetical protein B9Z55_003396 [Caenorhabditis nigoni]